MGRNELASYLSLRPTNAHNAEAHSADDDDLLDSHMDNDVTCSSANTIYPLLPLPIDDTRACQRCYVVDSCMLYRKV